MPMFVNFSSFHLEVKLALTTVRRGWPRCAPGRGACAHPGAACSAHPAAAQQRRHCLAASAAASLKALPVPTAQTAARAHPRCACGSCGLRIRVYVCARYSCRRHSSLGSSRLYAASADPATRVTRRHLPREPQRLRKYYNPLRHAGCPTERCMKSMLLCHRPKTASWHNVHSRHLLVAAA
jgi:hypothetical protein